MNYLAHAYLSFDDPEALVGNMISDFIKGKKQYGFPRGIQIGIRLHRSIDQYTDLHPSTKKIAELFRANYRLYSGAIADILYDHFLANDQSEFASDQSLYRFTQETYDHLEKLKEYHGEGFAKLFPYMKLQNWLYHYREDRGIERSLEGLRHRAKYITETKTAFEIFTREKSIIKEAYDEFFPSVKSFAANTFLQLSKS